MPETYHSTFNPEGQRALQTDLKRTRAGLIGNLDTLLVARTLSRYYKEGFRGNLSEADGRIYSILHGEHARVLGNKNDFAHLVRRIGYSAPNSMVVSAEVQPEQRAQQVTDYFPDTTTQLFVKPLNGTRQRDLQAVPRDQDRLQKALGSAQEDMVVQEFVPHERVLRYIRYTDSSGQTFYAAFSYVDPADGTKQREIPLIGHKKVNASGETYNELATNMLGTTADVLEQEGINAANLNTFMAKLVARMETELGGKLPFTSFDIAVRDMSVLREALSQPYSDVVEATLRDNLVFIESQSIPNPWELRPHNTQHPMKTYLGIWRLFLKEHGREMAQRLRHQAVHQH